MTSITPAAWHDILVHLLALAERLEGEGQLNIAKLLRAAADGALRQAAYRLDLPTDRAGISRELDRAIEALALSDCDQTLLMTLKRGKAALDERRLPPITETPNPQVCRTCGHIVVGDPGGTCPVCGAWPDTFQVFMPHYWFEAFDPFEALAWLRRTPDEAASLISGLPEDVLARQPEDGGWSIRHVIAHMRDAQGVLVGRVNLMLTEDNPSLASLAVFEWATSEETRPPTTRELFESYRAARESLIARLESIPLKDWWRTGLHEEFGPMTIRQQASYFAAHERTHLPQIAVLRRQLAG